MFKLNDTSFEDGFSSTLSQQSALIQAHSNFIFFCVVVLPVKCAANTAACVKVDKVEHFRCEKNILVEWLMK